MHLFGVFFLWSLIVSVLSTTDEPPKTNRTFSIDTEKNEFMKDGEIFRYVAGSIHYFRVPMQYWKDRIQKMKAAGLNTIDTNYKDVTQVKSFFVGNISVYENLSQIKTFFSGVTTVFAALETVTGIVEKTMHVINPSKNYVEWSFHEPFPGVYNFKDMADLEYFMKLVQDENMYLILRPGPYICAERDLGGLPYWLLNVTPDKSFRTNDSSFKKYVTQWFSVLMPKVQPYLYGNGGNIILVQVENEYGNYFACDLEYKIWIRDLFRSYVENNAVLFTVDVCSQSNFDCGYIPEVYATVDFGTSNNASQCFDIMKRKQKGPLVNSEFYVGWLSHWENPLSAVDATAVVNQMKVMLAMNASFNFYVFLGGTNFGFTSGANAVNDKDSAVGYIPQLTSYDYDAPLDEAGDPTKKYFMIKDTLADAKFLVTDDISTEPAPKGAYGTFQLQPLVSMFDQAAQRIKPVQNNDPLSFEAMDISTGFVMYETTINDQNDTENLVNLTLNVVKDRAIIYLDKVQVGTMSRLKGNTSISLNISKPVHDLSILVENQGRINIGKFLEDTKGIECVFLGSELLSHWTMTAYPLNETSWLSSLEPMENVLLPAFYRTEFTIAHTYIEGLDSYLDVSGWTKGVAFLNDFNLGRYWPVAGPQASLYVPGPLLKLFPDNNTLVMLELEKAPDDLSVKFSDTPVINDPGTV